MHLELQKKAMTIHYINLYKKNLKFQEKVMKQDPAALADLPQLTGSQLNALLTLFVAGLCSVRKH